MDDRRVEIQAWLEEGRTKGATHMLVVCDQFDYGLYPVYVLRSENVFLKADDYRTEPSKMRELMEVYSYSLPLEAQLAKRRAFHYECGDDLVGFPGQTEPVEGLQMQALWKEAGRLGRLLSEPMPEKLRWRQAIDLTAARLRELLPK